MGFPNDQSGYKDHHITQANQCTILREIPQNYPRLHTVASFEAHQKWVPFKNHPLLDFYLNCPSEVHSSLSGAFRSRHQIHWLQFQSLRGYNEPGRFWKAPKNWADSGGGKNGKNGTPMNGPDPKWITGLYWTYTLRKL